MIKCTICGTENPAESQYCDECGVFLKSGGKSPTRTKPPQFYETPKIQVAGVTSNGVPAMVDKHKLENASPEDDKNKEVRENKNARAKLVIERGNSIGVEFQLSVKEAQIGRWDADNGIFPDIDLDRHDPEAKVSRRHARIVLENEKYTIEDLGSTNGTFVNRGRRLIPGEKHILKDGDEIIVGKTFLRFNTV